MVCEQGCWLYAVVGLGSWSLGDWEGGRFLTKRLCATPYQFLSIRLVGMGAFLGGTVVQFSWHCDGIYCRCGFIISGRRV